MNKSQNGRNSQQNQSKIMEVYETNFVKEIKNMSRLLEEYNYVGMDTEFPGIVNKLDYSHDFYYKSIKANVDDLKLIQLGITLCNSKGENPTECSTWQFNLRFDMKKDKYSSESIGLLANSGIKFDQLKSKGIPYRLFAEYLMTSGLVLNPNIIWISYHGSSDFAYLLKLIINSPLPNNEKEFSNELSLYFPNHYDIKFLIQGNEQFKGGLNKIAQALGIYRLGEVHQAGSDSIVTAEVFFALLTNQVISKESITPSRNILYGLGEGEDNNETINYVSFNNPTTDYDKKPLMYPQTSSPNPFGQYPQSNTALSTGCTAYYPYMAYTKNVQPTNSVNSTYVLSMSPNTMPINNVNQQNGIIHNYNNFVA